MYGSPQCETETFHILYSIFYLLSIYIEIYMKMITVIPFYKVGNCEILNT